MKIKIYFAPKDTIKKGKGNPWDRKKICANHISDQGLVSSTFYFVHSINIQNIKRIPKTQQSFMFKLYTFHEV